MERTIVIHHRVAAALLLLGFLALPLRAQPAPKLPLETRNAALRYWLAFAEIQDPPSDPQTAELLEKAAAGEAPWDEAKLGPILDKNETAILILQRATKLPDCDWGLEYSQGPAASIAYVPRARVLARLNTLYGMRLAAKGDTPGAVNTWLAGIHFSQDLAKGGTLIFALVAKTALLSNLNALGQAAQQGTLSASERSRVAAAVRALPETAFDWSQMLALEQSAIEIGVNKMESNANPAEYYLRLMGRPAPVDPARLSVADSAAFAKVMSAAEESMRESPAKTAAQLPALEKSIASLNPIYRELTPSLTKMNESRAQVEAAREKLLRLLAQK
jgi:hypothetical protein